MFPAYQTWALSHGTGDLKRHHKESRAATVAPAWVVLNLGWRGSGLKGSADVSQGRKRRGSGLLCTSGYPQVEGGKQD